MKKALSWKEATGRSWIIETRLFLDVMDGNHSLTVVQFTGRH
jgi:hypothetical protein